MGFTSGGYIMQRGLGRAQFRKLETVASRLSNCDHFYGNRFFQPSGLSLSSLGRDPKKASLKPVVDFASTNTRFIGVENCSLTGEAPKDESKDVRSAAVRYPGAAHMSTYSNNRWIGVTRSAGRPSDRPSWRGEPGCS